MGFDALFGGCVMPRRDRVVREVYKQQMWKLNPRTITLGRKGIAECRQIINEMENTNVN